MIRIRVVPVMILPAAVGCLRRLSRSRLILVTRNACRNVSWGWLEPDWRRVGLHRVSHMPLVVR